MTGQFIAVLLPARSKAWKPAVDAIKAGLFAAEGALSDGDQPPLRVFDTSEAEDDILTQFNRARNLGAAAVIGPLTQTAVNNIADNGHFEFPVLALNRFDSKTLRRPGLYSFSLSTEVEAGQVANWMHDDEVTQPVVLVGDGALAKRMAQGFTEAWKAGNDGRVPNILAMPVTRQDYAGLRAQLDQIGADGVFLAMNDKQARRVRPFIGAGRPLYATSQINPGRLPTPALFDLAGIHYLDMPWIGDPSNPAWRVYEHARSPSNDVERLFALGVDTWRLMASILAAQPGTQIRDDGLTGRLRISPDGVVDRTLMQLETSIKVPDAEAPGSANTNAPAASDASQPALNP
ncbi:penicillin-binding protein activator [Amantichitinum ursilacus]|uniref:Penicillin-binding protein activator LpoA n=1 Tax=Amantichitinum ursilacus TaxID=857265 RepID=A0A0N0GMD6_9NEIS|nr:penicillin-binding protein activator [Amantichitinum ursilacus]KPC50817.1 Penicillin-binding protein activator LpoA precursor [Amantichitinum ursilacus]